MSSRHRHKRSLSRESHRASSSPKRKKSSDKQDKQDIILTSLTDLKSDVAACNSMETRRVLHEAWSSPSQGQRENYDEVEENDDTISVMVGNEFPSLTSQEVHESAVKPSESATIRQQIRLISQQRIPYC